MSWPRTAAVVGGGTMGGGFVQLLALAGIEVAVADVSAASARAARERAVDGARRFAQQGLMPEDAAERVATSVAAVSAGEAAEGADFVIEAVAEDPAVKDGVLREIEAAAPADAVIASNTSAIPIRELARSLGAPQRFLGTHWFNPPQWIPCVEVVPGPATAPEVTERTLALLERLGKRPVVVGDAAGFVANRIQFAMFKEAAGVVADGIATAEQVDEVVRSSFGFRLPFFGPFRIADMAGLDVYAGAYRALEADLGERFSLPPSVAEHLAAGRAGIKSGGGYLGPVEDPEALTARRDAAYVALARLLEETA